MGTYVFVAVILGVWRSPPSSTGLVGAVYLHSPASLMPTREDLVESTGDDELLFADGFDSAILGTVERCGQPPIVIYDRAKCILILTARDSAVVVVSDACRVSTRALFRAI